jgi:UDP-glucuronate 4-epimerase
MGKILVTGVAGFIGFHVSKSLLDKGIDVWGIDNLNSYYDVSLKVSRLDYLKHLSNSSPGKFCFEKIDISDKFLLDNYFNKNTFDSVIHLAAQAGVRHSIDCPEDYVASNLLGFFNILENSRVSGIKHLVYASTSSVYGANEVIPFAEKSVSDKPLQFYAATKRANELMAHSYSALHNLPTSGLRFFTVYGPYGRPDMALFKFTKNILENKPIDIFNNGDHARDFTYIDDIVEGILKVHSNPPKKQKSSNGMDTYDPPFRVLNIGNGCPVNLESFINEIENNLKTKAIRNYIEFQIGDIHTTYADTTELQNLTGFKPSTNIKDGIRNFIDWYRDYYHIK